MVAFTTVFACPHCRQAQPVVRYGYNRGGTQKRFCKACRKVFTPQPRSPNVTPEKEQQISDALTQRLSQRAIARLLKVSRDTVRKALKKRAHKPI